MKIFIFPISIRETWLFPEGLVRGTLNRERNVVRQKETRERPHVELEKCTWSDCKERNKPVAHDRASNSVSFFTIQNLEVIVNFAFPVFYSSVLKKRNAQECVETCILEWGTHFPTCAFRKPAIHMIHAWSCMRSRSQYEYNIKLAVSKTDCKTKQLFTCPPWVRRVLSQAGREVR